MTVPRAPAQRGKRQGQQAEEGAFAEGFAWAHVHTHTEAGDLHGATLDARATEAACHHHERAPPGVLCNAHMPHHMHAQQP